jgi:hypothetical protein
MATDLNSAPGLGPVRTMAHRQVFLGNEKFLPGSFIIAGEKSRDPGNTPVTELRAGMLMGRITASKKFAPAVIGVTNEAISGDETEVDIPAAVSTELARRIGATGPFKITGPPTTAGTVRTLTATYSALAASAVTITALGVKSTWTLTDTDGTDGGTFRLKVTVPGVGSEITAALAWNANAAAIQAAIIALGNVPTSGCTVTGDTSPRTVAFVEDLGNVLVEPVSDLTADGGVYEGGITAAQTAVGVDGRFVTGSLIQPTDGSEAPVTILPDGYPIKAVDVNGDNRDIELPRYAIEGLVDSSQIVNWPADASTKQWVVDQLNSVGRFTFDHKHGF